MRLLSASYLKRRADIELERILRYAAVTGLFRGADEHGLLELRDTRKGQPGFVIGNGPSLSMADLDRIDAGGYASIASNKIYLAFDDTSWRPDILTVADKLVAEEVAPRFRDINLLKVVPSMYRSLLCGDGEHPARGRTLFFRCIPTRVLEADRYKPKYSDNPLKGLFIGQTVTVLNIQLAAWLGLDPIILIGLDGKYAVASDRATDSDYGSVAITGGETNHFAKNYRNPGDRWSIPRPELHEIEYARCRSELERAGRTIINASRTSYVQAFARRDLDKVFGELAKSQPLLAKRPASAKGNVSVPSSAVDRDQPYDNT